MNLYYGILNFDFLGFMIFITALTIIMVFTLIFILNKFFKTNKSIAPSLGLLGVANMIVLTIIFIFQAKIPNQAYINKLKKENIVIEPYNVLFSNYNTLGFGICEKNNYTGKTCLNYLKYFEEKEKRKEKQKKSDDEKQKIIEENLNKI